MNPIHNKPASEVLAKYFAGEATPIEAMQIEEWLKKNENRIEFQKSLDIWNAIESEQKLKLPAVEDAWGELEPELQAKNIIRKRVLLKPYLIAASLISIIALSFIFYFSQQSISSNRTSDLITVSSGGKNLKQKLPDGSTAVLYKNSTIQYDLNFNATTREILLKGESYFNVVPNNDKPFTISVGDLKIIVVGTSFNVKQLENKKVSVQVQSGVVELSSDKTKLRLYKGQSCIYSSTDKSLVVANTIDLNSMSYATKNFSFQNQSLSEVTKLLEDAFQVDIRLSGKDLHNCRLTAEFQDKSLDYILQIITMTINSSYKRENDKVIIYGKGCESKVQ